MNGTSWLQENINELVLAGPLAEQGDVEVAWPNTTYFSASRRNRDITVGNRNLVPPIQMDVLKDEFLDDWRAPLDESYLKNGIDRPSK